jgi:hypothetical protein
MKRNVAVAVLAGLLAVASQAQKPTLSEISVDLKMDERDYVSGERVRAVVDVKNLSPRTVSVGYTDSRDTVLVEIFRSNDHVQVDRVGRPRPFVSAFSVKSNEGQLLETFLGDHYDLEEPRSYRARAVLVHGGYRYEGPYRAFSIVPGNYITSAKQMFAGREGVSRRFDLVRWARNGVEHAFLSACDEYEDGRRENLGTTDIGAMLRITKPTLSILPGGEVVVIHRNGADSFVRSEFWSMPDALVLRSRMSVGDPATAGQARIQELYKREGGIKPVDRPWWKFW